MATSATYLLSTGYHSNQMIFFYIPREGYPEGAAAYFNKMYQCENIRRNYAECFLRANPDAEFAKNHEERQDTEFRYTINYEDVLSVWKKGIFGDQWCLVYQGPWHFFVNKYLEESEHLHLFRLSKNLKHETLMTLHQAEKWIKAFKNSANKYDYVHEGVQAIQTQIDEISARQKMRISNALSKKTEMQAEDCHLNANNLPESTRVRDEILPSVGV